MNSEVAERPDQSQQGITDTAPRGYYDKNLQLPDFCESTAPTDTLSINLDCFIYLVASTLINMPV